MGLPEWTLLYLTIMNKGTISSAEVYAKIDDPLKQVLTRFILCRARKNLEKHGVNSFISCGSHSEINYELEEQYARLFSSAFEIIRIMDEHEDKRAMDRLLKNGKIKR